MYDTQTSPPQDSASRAEEEAYGPWNAADVSNAREPVRAYPHPLGDSCRSAEHRWAGVVTGSQRTGVATLPHAQGWWWDTRSEPHHVHCLSQLHQHLSL